nr:hypothetical protein [Mycoplasmopsis bovis]
MTFNVNHKFSIDALVPMLKSKWRFKHWSS